MPGEQVTADISPKRAWKRSTMRVMMAATINDSFYSNRIQSISTFFASVSATTKSWMPEGISDRGELTILQSVF